MRYIIIFYSLICCIVAELKLPRIFGDNMVLQQGKNIIIWGTADKDNEVTLKFGNTLKKTKAKANGSWEISLGKFSASKTAKNLIITSGKDKIELKNIVIGEVWYCAGQSNMRWRVRESNTAKETLDKMQNSNVRFIDFEGTLYPNGIKFSINDVQIVEENIDNYYKTSGWNEATNKKALGEMSAVAFYFAEKLAKDLNVPVGVINTAIGGIPMEAYLNEKTLQKTPEFKELLGLNWLKSDNFSAWCRGRAKHNLSDWHASGKKSSPHPFVPGFLFKAGVEPIAPFAIRGFLWYQGESNAPLTETEKYEGGYSISRSKKAFELLVKDFREAWKGTPKELPFYYVQLPGLNRNWPEFREMQSDAIKNISNSGFVVTYDVGDSRDVHPREKRIVGQRLALLAEAECYKKNVVGNSPIFESAKELKGKMIIKFKNIKSEASALKIINNLKNDSENKLIGFQIAGADEKFIVADAKIIGPNTIEVMEKTVKNPRFVRYAWENDPKGKANLGNCEGLLASPFRTDIKNK